ncbi:MAG: hypothetical protein ACP6IP_02500 [Candidatus Njordarchaeia archaeon]
MDSYFFCLYDRRSFFRLVENLSLREIMYRYSLPLRKGDAEKLVKSIVEGKCIILKGDNSVYLSYITLKALSSVTMQTNQRFLYYTWVPIESNVEAVNQGKYILINHAEKLLESDVERILKLTDDKTRFVLITTSNIGGIRKVLDVLEKRSGCKFVDLIFRDPDSAEIKRFLETAFNITSSEAERIQSISRGSLDLAYAISKALSLNAIKRESLNKENLTEFLKDALSEYLKDAETREKLTNLITIAKQNPVWIAPLNEVGGLGKIMLLENFLYKKYFGKYLILQEDIADALYSIIFSGETEETPLKAEEIKKVERPKTIAGGETIIPEIKLPKFPEKKTIPKNIQPAKLEETKTVLIEKKATEGELVSKINKMIEEIESKRKKKGLSGVFSSIKEEAIFVPISTFSVSVPLNLAKISEDIREQLNAIKKLLETDPIVAVAQFKPVLKRAIISYDPATIRTVFSYLHNHHFINIYNDLYDISSYFANKNELTRIDRLLTYLRCIDKMDLECIKSKRLLEDIKVAIWKYEIRSLEEVERSLKNGIKILIDTLSEILQFLNKIETEFERLSETKKGLRMFLRDRSGIKILRTQINKITNAIIQQVEAAINQETQKNNLFNKLYTNQELEELKTKLANITKKTSTTDLRETLKKWSKQTSPLIESIINALLG